MRTVFRAASVGSLLVLLVGIAMIVSGTVEPGAFLVLISALGLWSGAVHLPRKAREVEQEVGPVDQAILFFVALTLVGIGLFVALLTHAVRGPRIVAVPLGIGALVGAYCVYRGIQFKRRSAPARDA